MSTMRQTVRISDIIIPKYLPIFNNTKYRHIILTSGRAGTKSSYAAIRADYQIVADDKGSVVVLRKHHNKLRKTVYKEMLRGIARLGISKDWFRITKSPMEISYKKNGSTIYFSGSDGIDDTKGIIDEERPIKLSETGPYNWQIQRPLLFRKAYLDSPFSGLRPALQRQNLRTPYP